MFEKVPIFTQKCWFEAQNLLVWFPWQPCIFSKNEGKFQYIVFDPPSENQVFVKICDYAWPHFGWFLHGIALKCYSTQRNKDKYLRNVLSVSKLPNLKDLQIVLSNYERDL